ncbi:hypothetical protein C2L80_00740 [Rubneribacter badeniensis]|uniref:Uncharacterized protein n=1 Tax=Rubneribacter badeniensis TaxID=2070688 RepID=A0A2K2U8D2_9ACTN|nr:hypothetical protein C2L80_00740 [Rubneribacter badeniensis]
MLAREVVQPTPSGAQRLERDPLSRLSERDGELAVRGLIRVAWSCDANDYRDERGESPFFDGKSADFVVLFAVRGFSIQVAAGVMTDEDSEEPLRAPVSLATRMGEVVVVVVISRLLGEPFEIELFERGIIAEFFFGSGDARGSIARW